MKKENKAVQEPQMKLLKELMSLEALSEYCLVGGTSLSLRYQHRISVDLDLFKYNKNSNIDHNRYIFEQIRSFFGDRINYSNTTKIGSFMFIDNIKVDVIEYPYSFSKIENIDGIRIASKADVSAMKINAIKGRGFRKDFYDLNELLKDFSLKEILDNYREKYQVNDLEIVLRSLIYFVDAEDDLYKNNDVISLLDESWDSIKMNIEKTHKEYFKNNH